MKRFLIIAAAAIIIITASVYLIIPPTVQIEKTISIDNIQGMYRALTDSSKWMQWWPEKNYKTLPLTYHGSQYHVKDYTVSTVFIDIQKDDIKLVSELSFIPGLKNNVKLSWEVSIPTSTNPFTRIRRYLLARNLSADFADLLTRIKNYYSVTENMYGIHIEREVVKNSALVFTYDSSKGFPSTEKIYSMVEELKNYIVANKAHVSDSPMVNITTTDSLYYLTRVAVPADSVLKSNGKISYRWMLGGGNILTSEVVGGASKINSAFSAMELYMNDYHLASPAIPFYSLTINRLVEKDSSKWKSKIYYPVMYYEF